VSSQLAGVGAGEADGGAPLGLTGSHSPETLQKFPAGQHRKRSPEAQHVALLSQA
jgi:hypothetical protein